MVPIHGISELVLEVRDLTTSAVGLARWLPDREPGLFLPGGTKAMRRMTLDVLVMSILVAIVIPAWGGPGGVRIASTRVELLKTPNAGIQPQAAIDSKGVLHLAYL